MQKLQEKPEEFDGKLDGSQGDAVKPDELAFSLFQGEQIRFECRD